MDEETQTTGSAAPSQDEDTASDQTSEASVQTNNEAPEAAQEAKEPETKAEDTAEEKLYAGKYKSAEEMEKAYQELQSKATKDSQEKAELTRILNEAFTPPEATTAKETVEEDFEEPTPQVNSKEDARDRKIALLEFTVNHPDADGDTMVKVLQSDPRVADMSSYEAKLEYAYLRSQNMSQPKAIAEAQKTAKAESQAKTAEKQAAQVESAKKAEPVGDDSLLSKATGNYTAEDREAARKALIKKHLVNL